MNDEYLIQFEKIIKEQLQRVDVLKESKEFLNYNTIDKIVIGLIDGDGIGPVILNSASRVLSVIFESEIGRTVELRKIEGLTLENRINKMETVPQDVLAEIKKCHVVLKGPTTTPDKKAGMPNLESANVSLRKSLDLFANVRPVSIPERNINWTFYRENTEGEYALGNQGIDINDNISVDFKITTTAGTKRIAKAAFEFAKANGNQNVSIVTKANIMKKTDGKFLNICYDIAKEYPEIKTDDWYVDIMAANLMNESIRSNFNVFILPNLYGDIITDEAAQIQGGVGTAGSANIGVKHAIFEAIHGSAPRMVSEGLAEYANPSSILKATEMLLRHIGFPAKADLLANAISYAAFQTNMSGTRGSDTTETFTQHVISALVKK